MVQRRGQNPSVPWRWRRSCGIHPAPLARGQVQGKQIAQHHACLFASRGASPSGACEPSIDQHPAQQRCSHMMSTGFNATHSVELRTLTDCHSAQPSVRRAQRARHHHSASVATALLPCHHQRQQHHSTCAWAGTAAPRRHCSNSQTHLHHQTQPSPVKLHPRQWPQQQSAHSEPVTSAAQSKFLSGWERSGAWSRGRWHVQALGSTRVSTAGHADAACAQCRPHHELDPPVNIKRFAAPPKQRPHYVRHLM